jgi:hypothetical protein
MVQRLLASLACCGLLALAGCSDDSSSAGPDPSPSASSSEPSPSPIETHNAETPEAFLQHWVEADRSMENSGETKAYRSLSRGCQACDGLADQVERIYSAGGYIDTDGWTILSTRVSKADNDGRISVRLVIDSAPTEYVEEAGAPIKRLNGGRQTHLVTLSPREQSWNVDGIEQVAT